MFRLMVRQKLPIPPNISFNFYRRLKRKERESQRVGIFQMVRYRIPPSERICKEIKKRFEVINLLASGVIIER